MARILCLCSRPPYPPNDGARVRMYNLAKELARNHEVDVVAISKDDEYETPNNEFRSYRIFEEHPIRFYLRGVRSLFSRDPIQCRTYLSPKMKRWVDEHIEEYDLVYCTHLATVKYVEDHNTPKILDLVDAVSNNFSEFVTDSSFVWQLIYRTESKRASQYETYAADLFDRSIITTETDRQHIDSDNVVVVPNGVTEAVFDYDPSVSDTKEIVFLGDLSYLPNETAVKWYAEEIHSLVLDAIPESTFKIVGKSPSKDVRQLAERDGISVTGFVDDPYEHVRDARVSVAPVQIGGGIQNKVLEAMGLGRPVVTTQFGATGINVTEGTDLLIRDEPQAFARAVIDVLENRDLAERLSKNGRELIKQQYTWESAGEILNEQISHVFSDRQQRSSDTNHTNDEIQ